MQVNRYLGDVLEEMLKVVPPEEIIHTQLTTILRSVEFAAPENMYLWWRETYDVLTDITELTEPWHFQLKKIWDGDYRVKKGDRVRFLACYNDTLGEFQGAVISDEFLHNNTPSMRVLANNKEMILPVTQLHHERSET